MGLLGVLELHVHLLHYLVRLVDFHLRVLSLQAQLLHQALELFDVHDISYSVGLASWMRSSSSYLLNSLQYSFSWVEERRLNYL